MQVLIVDDSPDLRLLLAKALENEGVSSLSAQDGKEAISQLIAIKKPCLILLDLMMPVMDGFEFLSWKNKQPELSACPVIILSASTYSKLPEGADAYLQKPINLDRLFDLIESQKKLME